MERPWQIFIDTGGTFTDCLARDPGGSLHRAKVLSSAALRGRIAGRIGDSTLVTAAPWAVCDDLIAGFAFRLLDGSAETGRVRRFDSAAGVIELDAPLARDFAPDAAFEVISPEPAPLLAARLVTRTPAGIPLPNVAMRLATTRGTNALLERRGAPTALFITRGFGDLLHIGDQQRPDLFALRIVKPTPLPEAVVEVPERLAADGTVIEPIDLDRMTETARRLVAGGIRAAAITLMHSYVNPDHEQRLGEVLREVGFEHVACSAALAPLIKLLPRCETAVVDAYLGPVVGRYLKDVGAGLGGGRLHVMTSAGGLTAATNYNARDSLLSGPAGGVAGAAAAGRRAGHDRVIGFDMGGTSTDVARYDGDFEYEFEHIVGGVRLVAPALAIETVAAGGGSICSFDEGRLRVGPQSASADPGPACYGAGGPLTLTDVNLLLGRLDPDRFEIPLLPARAEAAMDGLCAAIEAETGAPPDRDEVLEGLLAIADERMADAIAQVSVRRGYDPAEYAMVAFGGAGGQHACAVADRLGMATIVMPAEASLLSAAGLGVAVIERFAQRQVLQLLDDVKERLPGMLAELARQAKGEVGAEGVAAERIVIRRRIVNLRLQGQETTLAIDADDIADLSAQFADRYEAMYGHAPRGKPIEVESMRVVASVDAGDEQEFAVSVDAFDAEVERTVRARFSGRWLDVSAFDRTELAPGATVAGPAIIFDQRSAYVIESGWSAQVDSDRSLIAREHHDVDASLAVSRHEEPEVVRQELFTNRFAAIAREMGQMLQRAAISTNVKERLDFSCALLDADGRLVVNAPHIPVHLGALGLCVRSLRETVEMREGDAIVTNHPAYGGSHLPDVTVVTPVFADGGERLGYVASRAHHAEIGGTRPGSMPPGATTLAEEGVVIEPACLVRRGNPRFDEIEDLLREAPHPSRAIADNIADLRAQVAANHRGMTALRGLARQFGTEEVARRMRDLTGRAERLTRAALAQMTDGDYEAAERLDDGSPIRVKISVRHDEAVIDFAGSAARHAGNLNATPSIVRSAVIYVMRLLIGTTAAEVPLNEGIMRPVQVNIPEGLLNPQFTGDPGTSPAVVGGNVETSQRIVDTLLKALKLVACSQGTMNNVLFGTADYAYYETVCGGCGAGPRFDGADAVHSHMTNTRITDPELLEHRYPVRLARFAVRRGSGGAGRTRGGDGAVREYLFLAPMSLSVLTQHRAAGPYGLDGGEAGSPGEQRVARAGGGIEGLGSCDGCEVAPGDRLILLTPGGGGFGAPCEA